MSPCLQDGSSLSPCARWLVSLAFGQSLQGRWVSKAGCAVLSVVGDHSGPLTAPLATSVRMHRPSPSTLNQRGLTTLPGCPKQSPLCPADPQGCVTARGLGEAGHEASLWLSKAFPSDLVKNTARNSHCLSFISFSCYGLSWAADGCLQMS